MKRFFVLFLLFPFLLTACRNDNGFTFQQKARYSVTEEISGISFIASIDAEYAEFVFTSPKSIEGLTAFTLDGVSYNLKYKDIETQFGGFSIAVGNDFIAALNLLRTLGETKNDIIEAKADNIYAEAKTADNAICEIAFWGEKSERKYKITTEA